ncbi:MAG: thiamine phosphate synthase [Vicinamibacterales bacterium]
MLPRLYAVCDADVCARAGWTLPDYAAALMDGGVTLLQLRAKHASSREVLAATEAVMARALRHTATVIVNDRADVARLADASGVHVGQDDLAPADVRRVIGEHAVLGLSTHTTAQLESAVREPVTYVAIGPVFGTTTKATGYDAVGIDLVRRANAIAAPSGLPVVAIGGITLEHAPDIIVAGAASVAVITDLLVGGDPTARARAFLEQLSCV